MGNLARQLHFPVNSKLCPGCRIRIVGVDTQSAQEAGQKMEPLLPGQFRSPDFCGRSVLRSAALKPFKNPTVSVVTSSNTKSSGSCKITPAESTPMLLKYCSYIRSRFITCEAFRSGFPRRTVSLSKLAISKGARSVNDGRAMHWSRPGVDWTYQKDCNECVPSGRN
jgi:hypothetical protein